MREELKKLEYKGIGYGSPSTKVRITKDEQNQIDNFYNVLFESAKYLKNIDKTLKDIAGNMEVRK